MVFVQIPIADGELCQSNHRVQRMNGWHLSEWEGCSFAHNLFPEKLWVANNRRENDLTGGNLEVAVSRLDVNKTTDLRAARVGYDSY